MYGFYSVAAELIIHCHLSIEQEYYRVAVITLRVNHVVRNEKVGPHLGHELRRELGALVPEKLELCEVVSND